jgi:taurine-pyruvate aminotransferase
MDGTPRDNDISKIVEADRAHIWHHLIQHKPFETNELFNNRSPCPKA